jgi:glycosyltransferase involved in cell wall biosynthesis
LSVGVVREIKGFDMLVDIAKIVFKKHPDWSWEIYGDQTSSYTVKIQEKINLYKLNKQLILKGLSQNIDAEYSKSAFIVMTSRMEGLPMVLLEAKAHNLPIVAFDIQTGPSDIVCDNQNGFLIEPYNIEKMAEKINLLIENDELRKQFSDNAVLDSEKFSPERIIEQWTSLLHNL